MSTSASVMFIWRRGTHCAMPAAMTWISLISRRPTDSRSSRQYGRQQMRSLAVRLAFLGQEIEKGANRQEQASPGREDGMHALIARAPAREHVTEPAALQVGLDQQPRELGDADAGKGRLAQGQEI